MAKYYCILFDADNTLLNFDAAESKALAETLVNYGIEPDAETVQTYRTINEELWRQLEKGQIKREKLMAERFTRFLKAVDAAGDGVEMNRFYLEQLSTHPDLRGPEVLDVLRELSEVATLAVVTNGFQKVQIRREKLFSERFSRFLKAIDAAGDGVEMNRYYLEQLSTHPDLMSAEVLDVLRELSEVATLAIVSNGAQKVQTRRLAESGVMNFMEDVFISEKMGCEKPNARIFDAALRALGVENREHVLMVGDSLASDIQGGSNAGLDTCWYNPNHAENPGKVIPTYEIASLEELYPLVMEPEELANVGLKNRRHQC